MWFPFNGWAAKVQAVVTRLEFAAGQAKDQEAAAAMARELDAAEFGARIDREARHAPRAPDQPAPSERSAPDD